MQRQHPQEVRHAARVVRTDLGNTIVGCLVNRKEAPLNIELENGATVEIITDKSINVDPAWLNFVVSSKARTGIRNQLRHQKISQARKAGKVMLESELKRAGHSLEDYRGGRLNSVLDLRLRWVHVVRNAVCDVVGGRTDHRLLLFC